MKEAQRGKIASAGTPVLKRAGLAQRAIAEQGRWIAIHGTPGMGRSTLLGQIADEFLETRDWFCAILSSSQLRTALSAIGYHRTFDPRGLIRWLGMQAASSSSGVATLLIDDFDTNLNDEHRALFTELMIGQPRLRAITVSVDPPQHSAAETHRGIAPVVPFLANGLLFTKADVDELAAEVVTQCPGRDELQDPVTRRRLYEVTRGVPGAVTDVLDSLTWSLEHPEHQFAASMNQFLVRAMRERLKSNDEQSLSAIYNAMSLMPRFSHLHVRVCFPDADPQIVNALAELPHLDHRRKVRAGDYAWSSEFLYAAREFNAHRSVDRRKLAATFYRASLAGEAFEQWFLGGDLARAEAMLRTRFLTVFETLSPETALEVAALPHHELAAFPMIRVMRRLLDPRATVAELRSCGELLSALGARGGAAGILALAVRAAVRARKGSARLAYDQAEAVLREVENQLSSGSQDTEAEQRTLSEAALVAVLVLLEIGTIPSSLSVLPVVPGSPFLRFRREKAQELLDRLRAEQGAQHSLLNSAVPHGYRSLVFSSLDCDQQIAAIMAHDNRFAQAYKAEQLARSGEIAGGSPAAGSTAAGSGAGAAQQSEYVEVGSAEPVRYFSASHECLRLLALDDQAGAVEAVHRSDVNEPHASVLRAMMMLVTGRARDARDLLDEMGEPRDTRIEAFRSVLRASAFIRLSQPEPARSELTRAEGLPATVLVQALSLLEHEKLEALLELEGSFEEHVRAAQRVGALGTGKPLVARKRFQPLTEKERDVLRGLRDGLNTREIAERDFLSVNTVRTHVRSIGKKLDASGQAEMLRRANELRLFRD